MRCCCACCCTSLHALPLRLETFQAVRPSSNSRGPSTDLALSRRRQTTAMAGWEVRWSKSRQRAYFYNVDSSESTWTPPEGLTDDDISKLDGAELLTTPLPAAGSSSSSPSKVQASHLLVKHEGSRRPSSWKEVSSRPLLHLLREV